MSVEDVLIIKDKLYATSMTLFDYVFTNLPCSGYCVFLPYQANAWVSNHVVKHNPGFLSTDQILLNSINIYGNYHFAGTILGTVTHVLDPSCYGESHIQEKE